MHGHSFFVVRVLSINGLALDMPTQMLAFFVRWRVSKSIHACTPEVLAFARGGRIPDATEWLGPTGGRLQICWHR